MRRRAPGSPRCCCHASTCSCSTSRPTTSTSTVSPASSAGSLGLAGRPCVLVSHDRTFLARTVTDVVELDEFTHRATRYGGGWQAYLDERAAAERTRGSASRSTTRSARRSPAGPSASGSGRHRAVARSKHSDEPDKNIRHYKINQTEQLAGTGGTHASARSSGSKPSTSLASRGSCASTIPTAARSGDVVARCSTAAVDRATRRRSRSARSTSLIGVRRAGRPRRPQRLGQVDAARAACSAASAPTAGARAARHRASSSARWSRLAASSPARPLLRRSRTRPAWTRGEARTLLAKFGLVADHVDRPPASLSPGERTRASLALLMANGANVLVLDEPTNHLDLPAIEQLEAGARHLRRHGDPRHPRPRPARCRGTHPHVSSCATGGSSATRR